MPRPRCCRSPRAASPSREPEDISSTASTSPSRAAASPRSSVRTGRARSMLLRVLANLVPPDQGVVEWDGRRPGPCARSAHRLRVPEAGAATPLGTGEHRVRPRGDRHPRRDAAGASRTGARGRLAPSTRRTAGPSALGRRATASRTRARAFDQGRRRCSWTSRPRASIRLRCWRSRSSSAPRARME